LIRPTDEEQNNMFGHHYGFGPFGIISAIIFIIPVWQICKRAGHNPWLSLLALVPLVNLFFGYWLAFGTWPAQKVTPAATP
jgi:hypothetical protein